MTYHSELASALRDRKCSETQVLEVLLDVHHTSRDGAVNPETEFGDAKQYAQHFSGSRRFSNAQLVRAGALVLSILVITTLRLTGLRDIDFFPWGVLQGIAVFVIIGVAGDIIGRRINRRMPAGFDDRA